MPNLVFRLERYRLIIFRKSLFHHFIGKKNAENALSESLTAYNTHKSDMERYLDILLVIRFSF